MNFQKIANGYYEVNGCELYKEYRKATGKKGDLGYVPGYYVWWLSVEDTYNRNLSFEGSFGEVKQMIEKFFTDEQAQSVMLNHYGNPITTEWLDARMKIERNEQ